MRRADHGYALQGRRRRCVTLLEVVLAIGLLGYVTAMTYWFYGAALHTSERGTDEAHRLRLARVMLERMSREIQQAAAITVDNHVGIAGEAERIWLSSYRVPTREQIERRSAEDEPPRAEYDLIRVEYRIARHPDIVHEDGWEFPLGLARVEVQVPRPLPPPSVREARQRAFETEAAGGEGEEASSVPPFPSEEEEPEEPVPGSDVEWSELYSPEIRYLRLCYHDGKKWWDRWHVTGETSLPQLVMVTLGFEPHPPLDDPVAREEENEEFCECLNEDPMTCEPLPADQYAAVVRIPQADPLFRSRVTRESQAFLEELAATEAPEEAAP